MQLIRKTLVQKSCGPQLRCASRGPTPCLRQGQQSPTSLATAHSSSACSSRSSSHLAYQHNTAAAQQSRLVTCKATGPLSKGRAELHHLPVDFGACMKQVAAAAEKGTEAGRGAEVLQNMDDTIGGFWFFVRSGEFEEDQPRALEPALAVVQGVLLSVEVTEQVGPRGGKRKFKQPDVLQSPGDSPEPYLYYITYELDPNGWPTGNIYPSASAFAKMTTERTQKKPAVAFKMVSNGCTLKRWHRNVLEPYAVQPTPNTVSRTMMLWARDLVPAAGGGVVGAIPT